jgi:hypothetical protein
MTFMVGRHRPTYLTVPDMVITCTLAFTFGPSLIIAVGEVGKPNNQLYITSKMLSSRDVDVNNLAAVVVASPTLSHLEINGKFVVIGT